LAGSHYDLGLEHCRPTAGVRAPELRHFKGLLMARLVDLFVAHPRSVGESYAHHARFAGLTGLRMVFAGLACVVHGLFPFLFVRTASTCIRELNDGITRRQTEAALDHAAPKAAE
jgi:hypothetical protein